MSERESHFEGDPSQSIDTPEVNPEQYWTTERTAELITSQWKGFYHNHPQERVRDPKTPTHTVDIANFFTKTWRMEYHGTLQHMQKAYPEERVLPPERIHAEAERMSQEQGGVPENYLTAAREQLREQEYHTPGDVEAWAQHAREQGREQREIMGGAEVDVVVETGSDGKVRLKSLTSPETLNKLNVDYLVYSVHPDTQPELKEIAGDERDAARPGDPENLTQVYEQLAAIAAQARKTNRHHPITMAGHPLSRTEARRHMTPEHKERIVKAFTDNRVPVEVALNDYYWWRPKNIQQAEQDLGERIPLLDPEFLALLKKYNTPIFIDTDLHFGDWMRDREAEAKEAPTKLGRQPGDTREFTAETMDEDLGGWSEKKLLALPRYVRPQVARFIRVVRHMLRAGIKPEQMINLKTLEEIRQLEGIPPSPATDF